MHKAESKFIGIVVNSKIIQNLELVFLSQNLIPYHKEKSSLSEWALKLQTHQAVHPLC